MTVIFEELREGKFAALAAELAQREVPDRPSPGPEEVPVPAPAVPVTFDALAREWPDHEAVVTLLGRLSDLEVERASRPPVISLTVSAGESGYQPGEYVIQTGENPVVSFSPAVPVPDSATADIPAFQEPKPRGRLLSFLSGRG